MTENLAELADRLSQVLEEETGLLDALDLPAAGSLLSRKRDAVAALQGAMSSGHTAPKLDGEQADALRCSVMRMAQLADANRAAIERGLALQMRLMHAIAQAVPRARATEAPIYQPDGRQAAPRPPEPYAYLSEM
jgi:hypothetical protein